MALTKDRPTPRKIGDVKSLGVAASMAIFAGAIVMRNAAGYAVKGATALNLIGVGRAQAQVVNSGSAGDVSLDVMPGLFLYSNSTSGDLITIADIGKPAWTVDDQTVAKTDGSGTRSIAGFVEDVDPNGVWVRFDEVAARSYAATLAAIDALS
jgi:hypothetical protein